jgi:hypothetical protein
MPYVSCIIISRFYFKTLEGHVKSFWKTWDVKDIAISGSRNNRSSAKVGKSTGAPPAQPFTVESETEMTKLLTFQGQLNTVKTESQGTKSFARSRNLAQIHKKFHRCHKSVTIGWAQQPVRTLWRRRQSLALGGYRIKISRLTSKWPTHFTHCTTQTRFEALLDWVQKYLCEALPTRGHELTKQIAQCKNLHTKHAWHEVWNAIILFGVPWTVGVLCSGTDCDRTRIGQVYKYSKLVHDT